MSERGRRMAMIRKMREQLMEQMMRRGDPKFATASALALIALELGAIHEGIVDSADEETPDHEAALQKLISTDPDVLSVRARNCLTLFGVKTYGDLCAHSILCLWGIPNCGKFTVREITRHLLDLGLSMKPWGECELPHRTQREMARKWLGHTAEPKQ